MAETPNSDWFKEFLRDYVLWTGGDQVVYNKRVRGLVQTGLGSIVSWIIQHTVPHVPVLTEGLLVAAVALGFITIWWAITAVASKYLSRAHSQKLAMPIAESAAPPAVAIHSADTNVAIGPSRPLVPVPVKPLPSITPTERPWTRQGYEATPDDLAVVYGLDVQRKIVRLKFQSDRDDKNEDALFLLLYGYWRLLDMADVPVASLNQSLWESGCRKEIHPLLGLGLLAKNALEVADIARRIDHELIGKHGLSRGGFYRLTERGLEKAKLIFIYMRDYA